MRISDWSSDVCSSDLGSRTRHRRVLAHGARRRRLLKIWPRRPTPGTHAQAPNDRRETMLGTMMDVPLLVSGILRHAEAYHGDDEVVSDQLDGGRIGRESSRERVCQYV